MSGVQPSPSVTGYFAVEKRHQLAIPPHRRLATGERVAPPSARSVEVVAREQGSAARAKMLFDARVVRPGAAGNGAVEMGEERHRGIAEC